MSMTPREAINQLQREAIALQGKMIDIAATKAVRFFTDNFARQGWIEDGQLHPWEPRKNGKDPGRPILQGIGRRRLSVSLRYIKVGPYSALIGSDVPYAGVHNEGLRINATQRVHPFTRRDGVAVKGFVRHIDFQMPKRQFVGESPDVYKSVERELFKAIEEITNKLK